ncbi:hypothetical protein HAP94_04540 [Acidithiobacillus ferrivorans]|nr:hypothetical protein [Acidithiobacillus ferrivorans]
MLALIFMRLAWRIIRWEIRWDLRIAEFVLLSFLAGGLTGYLVAMHVIPLPFQSSEKYANPHSTMQQTPTGD